MEAQIVIVARAVKVDEAVIREVSCHGSFAPVDCHSICECNPSGAFTAAPFVDESHSLSR